MGFEKKNITLAEETIVHTGINGNFVARMEDVFLSVLQLHQDFIVCLN